MSSSNSERWRATHVSPHYMVSSLGRVKSLARRVRFGKGMQDIKERILKAPICPTTGYPHVIIHGKTYDVHSLVVHAFRGPAPFPKAHINHINGVRSDPRLVNLEWLTASANAKHAYRYNGVTVHTKGKFGKDSNTRKAVIATCLKTGRELHFEAGMDAVRAGFKSDGISRACAGLVASHYGYKWRYADGYTSRTNTPRTGVPLRERGSSI